MADGECGVASFYQHKRQLRRAEAHIYYRLRSIADDAGAVARIHTLMCPTFPLVANLRCGLWYAPHFDDHCYFKSTDGHVGHWTFSTTRLNLNVIELACARGGCVIVDSTRKGKEHPDRYMTMVMMIMMVQCGDAHF